MQCGDLERLLFGFSMWTTVPGSAALVQAQHPTSSKICCAQHTDLYRRSVATISMLLAFFLERGISAMGDSGLDPHLTLACAIDHSPRVIHSA